MVTIYNVASGEAKTLDMVDAREHAASGRWAFTPAKPVPTPEPVADPAPVIEPDPAPVEAKLAALNAAMQKPKAKR